LYGGDGGVSPPAGPDAATSGGGGDGGESAGSERLRACAGQSEQDRQGGCLEPGRVRRTNAVRGMGGTESGGVGVARVGAADGRSYESGTSVQKTVRISKTGKARLRAILYMNALSAIRHDRGVRLFFAGLVARGKKRCRRSWP